MRISDIISIMHIIDIIRLIDIISITLSAWVSVLNPIFQKMSSIKWTIFLFNMNTFFEMSPMAEYLNKNNAAILSHSSRSKRKTEAILLTYRLWQRAVRPGSFRWWDAILASPSTLPGKDKPPYRGPRTRNTCHRVKCETREIYITNALHLPQDWSWRLYPVLSGPLRSEQINRDAVLRMRLDAAIKATQIGQNVMRKAVVMLVKRTLPGIINIRLDSAPPVSGLLVVGQIKGTKTLILRREPAT